MEKPEDTYTNHTKNADYYGVPKPPYTEPKGTQKTVSAPINIRSGPGTTYKVIGGLMPGTKVIVLETDPSGWARIGEGKWCKDYYLE